MHYENGYINDNGKAIVKENKNKSQYWYRLSAEQGNSDAQLAIGNYLSDVRRDSVDFESAIDWTKRALKQGNNSAAHNLGTIYRDMGKFKKAYL